MNTVDEIKNTQDELKELLEITKSASLEFAKLIKSGKLKNKISIISGTSPGINTPLAVRFEHQKINVTIVYTPEVGTNKSNAEIADNKANKYLPINQDLRVENSINNGFTERLIDNFIGKFPTNKENQSDLDLVHNVANELNPLSIAKSIHITKRQRQIIELIGDGSSNKEIAQQLNLSPHTVKSHVSSILGKLSLKTRVQIAKYVHLSKYYKIAM
jgi:DNA-binding CsgD family transcriptional regulator